MLEKLDQECEEGWGQKLILEEEFGEGEWQLSLFRYPSQAYS